jgi:TonB family protein
MLLACGLAVVILILIAVLGPDEERLQQLLFHTGVEGELRILPEIQIIQEEDPVSQEAKQAMAGATQGLDVEVVDRPEQETPSENPTPAPPPRGQPDPTLPFDDQPRVGAVGADEVVDQVRMVRPTQRSNDFILVKLVRPQYPPGISPALRRRTFQVDVAVYVEADGKVSGAYVTKGEGGRAFEEAALSAVRQWEYRYVGPDGKAEPFWDQVRWIFAPRGPAVSDDGS